MFENVWKTVQGLFGRPTRSAPLSPEVAVEKWDGQPHWCLVGNVVEQREHGTDRGLRCGTKHFARGTKVYCAPPQWGDGYEKIVVVGLARKPRHLITLVMPASRITNWRAQMVHKPAVLKKLVAAGGFWESKETVEAFVRSLAGK